MPRLFLLILLTICRTIGFAQTADLVLTNGNIITLKTPGHRAQAVAIAGDKILAVGSTADIKKYIDPHTRLIDLLRRKAAVTPKGMLIRGVAYNEVLLGTQPTRNYLDQASTEHPILIRHASGHVSAANSYLLRASHIDHNTQDPPGGALERTSDGEPDGIIK